MILILLLNTWLTKQSDLKIDTYFNLNAYVDVFPVNRLRIKNSKTKLKDNFTIIAKVSNDLSKYYSTWLHKETGVILTPPEFETHITISDNRRVIDVEKHSEFLKEIQNKKLTVKCSINPYLHWEFYALLVKSPEISEIQKQLGLATTPLHITIGKVSEKSKQSGILTRQLF